MNWTVLKTRMRGLLRDEDGSYTVEIVLWFPALLVAFQFVTDATLAMMYQQSFHNVARDASRMVALGQRTTSEAEEYIVATLNDIDNLETSVVIANNFVTSTISAPLGDLVTLSGSFGGSDLDAQVSMWVENYEGS